MAGSRIEHRGQSSQETGLSFFPPAPPRQGSKLRRGQGVAALGGPLTAANGEGEGAWARRGQPQGFLAGGGVFPFGASAAWGGGGAPASPRRLSARRGTPFALAVGFAIRGSM